MDPLSLAASVAGFVSLGLEITKVISDYATSVKHAAEESSDMATELSTLIATLESLERFLRENKDPTKAFSRSAALLDTASSCGSFLESLKSTLAYFMRVTEGKSWHRRLVWPYKKGRHVQAISTIQGLTRVFHFSITIDEWSVMFLTTILTPLTPGVSDLLSKTTEEIVSLRTTQLAASRDLSEILVTIDELKLVSERPCKCKPRHFQSFNRARRVCSDLRQTAGAMLSDIVGHEQQKLLDWLTGTADPSTNHNAAVRKHEVDTGLWFLESEEFCTWIDSPGFLWLYGIPGCGKTILCSTIIEALKEICQVATDRKLAYFYFDFQKVGEQDDNVLLRCILRQLCAGEAKIPDTVQGLYAKHIQLGHQPSKADLENALFAIIASLGKEVYIVLDALDEIPNAGERQRERVLQQIEKLVRHIPDRFPNLNVLATSRNERDIRKALEPLYGDCISIQSARIEADIRKYVNTCLEEDCFRSLGRGLKETIERELAQQADGMFRWVFCQMDALRHCKTPRAIRTALKTLPKTLDDTYERILTEMASQDAEEASGLLPWLLHSERPLTLQELAEAAVLRPESLPVDPDDRLFDHRDVLRICRGLVIVSRERISSNHSHTVHDVVRFSHFSVKEYLMSSRSKAISAWDRSGHEYIARCCVSSLLQLDFPGLTKHHVEESPLLPYAAQYWSAHVRRIVGEQEPGVLDDVYRLLDRRSSCFQNWIIIWNPASETWLNLEHWSGAFVARPLFYASLLGLSSTAKRLVADGADVNERSGRAGTALHGAAEFGSCGIADMLLEHGAAVNAYCGYKGTPLEVAVKRGHEDVVRLLLQRGADANARVRHDDTYISILQASILHSHGADTTSRVATLLMDHGADVNAPGEGYSTALALACRWGMETLVQELLRRGADVNAEGASSHGTALQQAAAGGHAGVVQWLLERGASANAPGCGYYLSALEAAACGGNLQAVEALLEHGADVNATCRQWGSALQTAAGAGHIAILLRLLEAGADVNLQGDDDGQCALLKAAKEGQGQAVQLLLEHGADVNLQSDNGESALLNAAKEGHDQIARLLLEHGADVNLQNDNGGSALLWAADRGHRRMVQLLLEHGADVNAPSSLVWESALQAAAESGDVDIVRQLLLAGADVDAPPGQMSGTALQAAAERGHVDVVRQLLQAGADADAQAPRRNGAGHPACGHPLQAASRRGRIEVVRLLIDAGADVNARHEDCGTALGAALRHSQDNIAELLRSSGALELVGEEAEWHSDVSSDWESGLGSDGN